MLSFSSLTGCMCKMNRFLTCTAMHQRDACQLHGALAQNHSHEGVYRRERFHETYLGVVLSKVPSVLLCLMYICQ